MAQQIINNGDSGLICRDAINDNFTEIYGFPRIIVGVTPPANLNDFYFDSNTSKIYSYNSTLTRWQTTQVYSVILSAANVGPPNYLFIGSAPGAISNGIYIDSEVVVEAFTWSSLDSDNASYLLKVGGVNQQTYNTTGASGATSIGGPSITAAGIYSVEVFASGGPKIDVVVVLKYRELF